MLSNFELYLNAGSAWAYLLAFLGGVLASFTPCIYPLIPITIGYIGAKSIGSPGRGFLLSLIYVLGVALCYSILGGIASITGRFLGEVSRSPWAYFILGNVCLILSLSLWGLFNLPLPKFAAPSKAKLSPNSVLSVFFVGVISALVVSPCTAPILGAILLFVAMEKNILFGVTVLFTFAYGMGFLLILVGTFSSILASLPRSGPWLVRIKMFFAVVLLLVSEYYFIQAGRLF